MQEFMYKWVDDGTYCVISYKGDEAEIVIPDTYGGQPITILSDNLFKGHEEITSVHIPDTVTDLGEFIFDGCVNLHHIELPSQLAHLWGYTFVRCGIEEITMPAQLKALPPFAFKDCKQLKKVVCGSGMKKIYAWAFGGCDQLKEVIYGEHVDVSPEAFSEKNVNSAAYGR